MFLMRGTVKTAIALTAAIALTWMVSASAWAAGSFVYDAVGEVSAAVGKNAAQRVTKNDAIVPDTMITTGDKSYAVLKFEDGQVVTLQSNSVFHVRQYKYNPKRVDQSSAVFSMFKGGMRFITGLIGQRNKKAFRLATPNATIGIRGTEFMVALVDGVVYSQVVSGGIRMTNDAGTAVFTAGRTVVVSSARSLPMAISVADLPAGTFTQLETISIQPVAHVPASAGGTTTVSTAATGIPTIATGAVSVVSSATTGITASAPATAVPTAIPATVPAAGTPGHQPHVNLLAPLQPVGTPGVPGVDFLPPHEPGDLAFFLPVPGPASTAVSDAALTAATGDAANNVAAAANISRNEAAAGFFGKHNLTSTGIGTGEICAFCHAPQGAETKVAAPLWNRSLSSLSGYRAYSSLGSATAAASGSVSMACLSCHDGTQAPNTVINTPGANGADTVNMNGTKTDLSHFMKGHHPVGMQYGGGGPSHAMPGATLNFEDYRSTTYSGSDTGTVWWVETGRKGRQKADILLFTRTDEHDRTDAPNNESMRSTNESLRFINDSLVNESLKPHVESLGRPYVECASCHDPHQISTPTFLRRANNTNPIGSALCLTCHAK